MIRSSGLVLTVMAATAIFTGCGRDMKLAVKAAESEKDQPSSALVRKVEVSYHSPSGKEEMRESIPVIGMGQPISMKSDLLKGVTVEKGGAFEARGYSADGYLLLMGLAPADPDENETVEIIMSRESSQAAVFGSPLLRRIRLTNAPGISKEFIAEVSELRAQSEKTEQCVKLPPLKMSLGAGSAPKLIFEGSILDSRFKIDVGVFLGTGQFQSLSGGPRPLSLNSAAASELDLGRDFLDGILFKRPLKAILRIHSTQYEGCLLIDTRPELLKMELDFETDLGAGVLRVDPSNMRSVGNLRVTNPNDFDVHAVIKGRAFTATGTALNVYYHQSNNENDTRGLLSGPEIVRVVQIGAHSSEPVSFFGGYYGDSVHLITVLGVTLRWSVEAYALGAPELAPDVSTLTNSLP